MIKVHTKKMSNGVWCCYATIDGYDYSFSGETKIAVQGEMLQKLIKCGKTNYAVWEKVEIIPPSEKSNKITIGYAKNRIDNL